MTLAGGESRTSFDGDAALVPLINVVFLLLLFFVLAGTFQAVDLLGVSPPESRSIALVDERLQPVLLSADGELAIGDRSIDAAELSAELERLDLGAGDEPVWLKADAAVEARRLLEVLRAFQEAGVERLRLYTSAAGDEG